MQAACEKGAAMLRGKKLDQAACEQRRRRSVELNLAAYLPVGSKLNPAWTAEQLALLGTMPDADVAARIGRTVEAVRAQRTRRGIATARDRRRKSQ
jgi:hypothetical protein